MSGLPFMVRDDSQLGHRKDEPVFLGPFPLLLHSPGIALFGFIPD
jgi:hypothetical protein